MNHHIGNYIAQRRKELGLTQQKLAEQLNISFQAVSKWESGMSIPDLEKIVKMSALFGVSTDYLLKEEIEEPELKQDVYEPLNVKHISAEFANEFMDAKRKSALKVAIGASICAIVPVPLYKSYTVFPFNSSALSDKMNSLAVS